ERGPVERRIAIEALEAVAREHRAEGRRDGGPPLGIEPQGVVGHEAVHGLPPPPVAPALLRREQRAPAPPLPGGRSGPPPRMGHYGLSWDRLGVKSVRRRRSRPARADLRILLMGFRLKEWLRGASRSLQRNALASQPPPSQANSSRA